MDQEEAELLTSLACSQSLCAGLSDQLLANTYSPLLHLVTRDAVINKEHLPSWSLCSKGQCLDAGLHSLSSTGQLLRQARMELAFPCGVLGFPGGSVVEECTCQGRRRKRPASVSGSGRSPGGGNSNSLLYSCLENP